MTVDQTNERNEKGQFVKGNHGGPGRPPRLIEREYLKAITEVCSLTEWQEITRRAVEDAKNGDARARQWLTTYLIGKRVNGALENIALDESMGVDYFEERKQGRQESREFSKLLLPNISMR